MLQHANRRLLFQALLPFSPDSGVLPRIPPPRAFWFTRKA
jgi:hypothetical protein